jgi:antitoxin component YwqK of YwqJK toxin-antitoxin module
MNFGTGVTEHEYPAIANTDSLCVIIQTMRIQLLSVFVPLLFFSCNQKETSGIEVIKFDIKIIDTLTKTSDTTYSTFIGRHDFYTEDVYAIKKDSLVTKILKDSLGNVVGINKSKNGVVIFAAEYYPNGQLKGKTQFKPGVIDGPVTYYYPDGRVKSIGQWHNYRQVGIWKNYQETGELKEIVYYDSSGDIIKTDSLH